ncbi:MAG: tRNA epoxyqueuosine(34) reductase QueG, partial [Nitrospirae bacterium]|nr:tRNA epoxyqueuosine(34) reductase QueG [Nitrospirota bacterium]
DYHKVIKSRLKELLSYIDTLTDGRVHGKIYVDTGPVLEKHLAVMAGLGWMGKHSLVVSQNTGSWSLLGVLLLDTELDFDEPGADQCGECTRCMEACPANALTAPYILDARKCISYLLGELKGSIPLEMRPLIGNRIFGCDDCQWVCLWNSAAKVSTEEAFLPRQELTAPLLVDLIGMDEERFRSMFDNSPIKRIKWGRFLRNVAVAIGNSGDKGIMPALERRLSDPDPLVREHVEWAIERLK